MWPRYILGGIMFGVGMTLASGCGNRTLVRIGGGNIKSVLVLIIMGMLMVNRMALMFLFQIHM